MNQNPQHHKKKALVSNSIKLMIAIASIAGTVGMWGLLSKKDVQATIPQASDGAMPTIATLISVDTSIATSSEPGVTSVSSLPVVTQPATISAAAPNIQLVQPAPVTTTRSSR